MVAQFKQDASGGELGSTPATDDGSAPPSSAPYTIGPVLMAVGVSCAGAFAFGYHLGVVNGPLETICRDLGVAGNKALEGLVRVRGGVGRSGHVLCCTTGLPGRGGGHARCSGGPGGGLVGPAGDGGQGDCLHTWAEGAVAAAVGAWWQPAVAATSLPALPARVCPGLSASLPAAIKVHAARTHLSRSRLHPPRCHALGTGRRSQVVSSTLAGAALGSLSGGALADSYGRRATFLMCAVPMVAGPLLSAFGTTFSTMVAGRLLAGVAIGVSSALVPTYISEVRWCHAGSGGAPCASVCTCRGFTPRVSQHTTVGRLCGRPLLGLCASTFSHAQSRRPPPPSAKVLSPTPLLLFPPGPTHYRRHRHAAHPNPPRAPYIAPPPPPQRRWRRRASVAPWAR